MKQNSLLFQDASILSVSHTGVHTDSSRNTVPIKNEALQKDELLSLWQEVLNQD